jgi:hypothetical protein
MIANDGYNEGLFRGGFMQSGALPFSENIDSVQAQLRALGNKKFSFLSFSLMFLRQILIIWWQILGAPALLIKFSVYVRLTLPR